MLQLSSLSILLVLGAGAGPSGAGLGLHLERSFTIKGPMHYILSYTFADVNHDGIPEVLAQDTGYALVYSISGDSVVAVMPRGNLTPTGAVFADVNRDGVPDVVLGYAKGTAEIPGFVVVKLFDGAKGFSMTAVDTFRTNTWNASGPGGPGVLACADVDRDGFGELILSVDSTTSTSPMIFPWIETREAGSTFCFHSFPDSLLWKSPFFLRGLDSASVGDGKMDYLGEWYSYFTNREFGPGKDIDKCHTKIVSIQEDGSIVDWVANFTWFDCNVRRITYTNYNHLLCSGTIDNDRGHDILASFHHDGDGYPFCFENSDRILLYRLVVNAPPELLYSQVPPQEYYSYVYHPLLPGRLLARTYTNILVVDGVFLQPIDSLPPLPAGGLTWKYPLADGIPRLVAVNGMTFSIYSLEVPTGISDGDRAGQIPVTAALLQNYPNPFNPSTVIEYTLPERAHVSLSIYNLLGEHVTRLVDETQPPGTHRATWNGKSASGAHVGSGVYFYRLEAGGFVESRKMLLLK